MDISTTTAPKSDQLNFDDVASTETTVTVDSVKSGTAEQPVEIHLIEYPGRPFKPSKSMRRVLVAAWGSDSKTYIGRRMTLYGDPTVKFGGIAVGGIRIRALSDIEGPLNVSLTVTRGKRAPFVVQPLANTPSQAAGAVLTPPDGWRAQLAAITTLEALNGFYKTDARNWWTGDVRDAFTAKKKALTDG